MTAREPVIHISVSLGDGTSVRAAGDSKPWVVLGGLQDICVHPHSAAVAREVAQVFIEVAGLIEQRERDADPCPAHDLNMPHDTRYEDWRSCPPNCRYLRWSIRHGLTSADAGAEGGA